MDPSSPTGAAPRPRRYAEPESDAPADTGDGGYDGYDGRYGRRARPRGATSVLARPADADPAAAATAILAGESTTRASAVPVAPTRRRRYREDDGDTGGSGAVVTPDTAASRAGRRTGGPFGARRIGIGILLGAALMLTVASLDSLLGAQVPVLGSFAAPAGAGDAAPEEPPPAPPPPDTPGTCLNWSRADATDTAAVGCAQPHLFEQAGRVALADQPTFPSNEAWQKLVGERCTPVVTGYLNNRFDPDGKFRVGALKPSQARWNEGDKGMRCGLQSASRSGAMFPITGRVAEQDQSAVQPTGTCLAIDGRTVGDPTGCAGPHAVETVGMIDLGTQFPEEFPSVEDQDKYLQPTCTKAANDYAGNDRVIGDKGLTVYWNNLSEESWKAGSRKINCNVGTLLPDGSGFASITGSLKGQVAVSDQAAPPAGTAPGAPATPGGSTAPSAPGAPGSTGGQAPVQQSDPAQPAAPDSGGGTSAPPPSGGPEQLDVPPLPGLSP